MTSLPPSLLPPHPGYAFEYHGEIDATDPLFYLHTTLLKDGHVVETWRSVPLSQHVLYRTLYEVAQGDARWLYDRHVRQHGAAKGAPPAPPYSTTLNPPSTSLRDLLCPHCNARGDHDTWMRVDRDDVVISRGYWCRACERIFRVAS